MLDTQSRTEKWIADVVIDCGLCPFAAEPFSKGSINYRVESQLGLESALLATAEEIRQLSQSKLIETTLIVFENSLADFDDFLDFIAMAEQLLEDLAYQEHFLFAHFHPYYQFEGLEYEDAANFSNRSPKPILQLLRQSSIDSAVTHDIDLEIIPQRNIEYLRSKGAEHFIEILERITKT